ncbi:hypothetical protein TNCV_1303241 [Trichonephila clavipes]|nr:hypothetical protein TNCV_1303241 [Trichonephila clavipes]
MGHREHRGIPRPPMSSIREKRSGLGSRREKEKWNDKRVENREGYLGHPGYVTPVFTKNSKPLGKKEKIPREPWDCDTRTHLKKVSPLSLLYLEWNPIWRPNSN